MTHTFKLLTANQPATLERILRVVRHRGFSLQSIQVSTISEQLSMELSLLSERPLHLLTNQLQKLHEVDTIEIHSD